MKYTKLPCEDFIPFAKDIDAERDKLIDKQLVTLKNSHKEAYSSHYVETYKITDGDYSGRYYHLFKYVSGDPVTDYEAQHYYDLSEFIDVSFKYTIFMKFYGEILPLPVNPDCRILSKTNKIVGL